MTEDKEHADAGRLVAALVVVTAALVMIHPLLEILPERMYFFNFNLVCAVALMAAAHVVNL